MGEIISLASQSMLLGVEFQNYISVALRLNNKNVGLTGYNHENNRLRVKSGELETLVGRALQYHLQYS